MANCIVFPKAGKMKMNEMRAPQFSGPDDRSYAVEFCGDDGFLLHELQGLLGPALAGGASVVVIATAGHIDNLACKLSNQGIDPAAAQTEDRYIPLEVTQFLAGFMVQGRPDPAQFSEIMNRLIARAAAASRDAKHRVVVFGEMAVLLWSEGKSDAALRLERLWNELAKKHSFSLPGIEPAAELRPVKTADPTLKRQQKQGTGPDAPSPGVSPVRHNGDLPTGNLVSPDVEWRANEEPFRLFIESVPDYAIFMLDPGGRIASWNTGAERTKGYKAAEIIGRHFSAFYTEEDQRSGRPQKLLSQAAACGAATDEGWRVRKDGSRFWAGVTITAIRDATSTIIGYGKVTRDLTERRRAELALRRSEERAHAFIGAVQDYAIFMLDPEGLVSTWNTGAERIKGYRAAEIIGRHFSTFYPDEDRRAGKPDWELHVAASEGRFEDEGWRLRKDGSRFWANVIITPLRSGSGELMGFSKVTRDFTERMLAQRALEESRHKLQESESSLRELSLHLLRTQDEERRRIGREIHDSLGQYLTVLKMRLDLMNADSVKREELEECSGLVEECVREVRTISYLLYPPMLEEMGLTSAIPWYLEGFSKRSGIETTFHASEDFGRLSRDAELVLFRVLQESLTNVQRHSGSPVAQITLSVSVHSVTLEVADRGKGIPAEILEHAHRDWMGSLGVGLRGMSERLRQLGGTLHMSSSPKGTQVRATVPLRETPATEAPSA